MCQSDWFYWDHLNCRGSYSTGDTAMRIHIYADTSQQVSDTKSGGIVGSTLADLVDTIYDFTPSYGAGSIDYIEVKRYEPQSSSDYPDVSSNNIDGDFKSWLQSGNESSEGDLTDRAGCHLLVHGYDMWEDNLSRVNADGDPSCPDSAFTTSMKAWMGTNSNDSDGLIKNAAIQEPLHTFINYEDPDVQDLINSSSQIDEHRLGKVVDQSGSGYGPVTPMLTFHQWESDQVHKGDCSGSDDPSGYTSDVTFCTKDAVYYTADGC